MAPFPYLPMTAIMACIISQQVVLMRVFAYSGFMVEYLGAVDDKDKAGETWVFGYRIGPAKPPRRQFVSSMAKTKPVRRDCVVRRLPYFGSRNFPGWVVIVRSCARRQSRLYFIA